MGIQTQTQSTKQGKGMGMGMVSTLLGYIEGGMDRVVRPETRRHIYTTLYKFADERPVVASLLATLTLLSLTPLLLFITFAISVLLFACTSAVLFSVFWIGLALLILVPTLFVCIGLGVCVWAWGLGTWVIGMWAWGLVFGREEKGVLVRTGSGGRGMVNGVGKEGANHSVKEVPQFEDVDCLGMMGGGMELGCG